MFFSKIPRSGKVDFYKFRVFFQKIPCFTEFPGFQIFKSLKNTQKNHVFLYKNIYLQVKSIYLRIKKHLQKTRVQFMYNIYSFLVRLKNYM